MHHISHKTKQFFFVLIKISIVSAAFYFIYYKLFINNPLNFTDFISNINTNKLFSAKPITVLLGLTCINWFFEIKKWQTLMSFIKKISFMEALKQSLGALTASLFTPNRIGEYGAKAVFYKIALRKQVMLITFLSNILQMAITVIFGSFAGLFFIKTYRPNINYNGLGCFLFFTIIVFGFLIGVYYSRLKWIEKTKVFIKNYPKTIIATGFLYALLRYGIFSFQYFYLLRLFGNDITYFNAMIFIGSMYLFASILPSISIFDIVIKGGIALYLFNFVQVDELTILSITTLMWLLNFVLPSLFGSYYILNFTPYKVTS